MIGGILLSQLLMIDTGMCVHVLSLAHMVKVDSVSQVYCRPDKVNIQFMGLTFVVRALLGDILYYLALHISCYSAQEVGCKVYGSLCVS